jgi:NTP pyrophosphatase (non-canonical NTP hydrolase)
MPDDSMPEPTVPNAQFIVGGRKYVRLADDWWEEYENTGIHHPLTRASEREAQLLDRLLIVMERDMPVSNLTIRSIQELNATRSARWMAGSPGWTTLEIAGELAGEVGELANVCKKLRRSEMGVPGNKLSDEVLRGQARGEIADVFIVLMLTASKLGIDLEDAVRETFNQKSEEMGFPERIPAARTPGEQHMSGRKKPEAASAAPTRIGDPLDFFDAHGLHYRGTVVDIRHDQPALGPVCYVAVRGYPPIASPQLDALAAAHLTAERRG